MSVLFPHVSPAAQIVMAMERIYARGMTTTSGGNLSVKDATGCVWITPSGTDKGNLSPEDICCVRPDGTTEGRVKPSMELPFHLAIYQKRPDYRAILHAHPPSLSAYASAGVSPDLRVFPEAHRYCGTPSTAAYALAGSDVLSTALAEAFAETDTNAALMENHGVCVGAATMPCAFKRFETLESLSETLLYTQMHFGTPAPIAETAQSLPMPHPAATLPNTRSQSNEEQSLRRHMTAIAHRAYAKRLFGARLGTCSVRLSVGGEPSIGSRPFECAMLISPYDADNAGLTEADWVFVVGNAWEHGTTPSIWLNLHQLIYASNPDINAIMMSCPPFSGAFAAAGANVFPSHVMMESYVMLRRVPYVPYDLLTANPTCVADMVSPQSPVLLCGNVGILTAGASLLAAFDRLEVAESTAHVLISAQTLGGARVLSDERIEQIATTFIK